jgi:hypothetical protein
MKVTSKITKETYTNRYGDEFTFTLLENGNIQWEGKFEYCRFGWPNDYTQALFAYIRDTNTSCSLEEFKKLVHESIYDEEGKYVGPGEIAEKYRHLVTSKTGIIDMVDPSGGPYLTEGMKIMGKVIKEFKPNEKGYLIITK